MVKNEKTALRSSLVYLLRVLIFLSGLIGPFLTGRLYVSMEGGDLTSVSWDLLIPISIGYGASVVIAILAHLWIKDFFFGYLDHHSAIR
jgi:hypothetical protein